MFCCSLRKNHSIARKAVALLVLCGVLFATVPIPIGWKPKSMAGSDPFPCQDCNCGCLTAEQCWTSCCCYTPEERSAWAIEHGVEPPSYAVLVSESALVSKTERLVSKSKASEAVACGSGMCEHATRREHATGNCIAVTKANSKACSAPRQPTCKKCKKPSDANAALLAATHGQDGSESVVVLSISAMKCRGLSSDFSNSPWATLRVPSASCSFPEPIVTPFEVCDQWLPSVCSPPSAPPPRLSI